MPKIRKYVLLFLLCVFTSTAHISPYAQTASTGNEPLEITADSMLEWSRNNNQFVAEGNAVAKQGDVSVSAQSLLADYRDKSGGNDSGLDIWQVTATNNVVITSRENKAYGQKAVYNLDKAQAIMTGNDLKLVSGQQTVTANERFEYWTEDGKLLAIGRAKMSQRKPSGGTDTLEADIITATLHNNTQGKREIETLEAEGNVVITTPQEKITGNYGIYHKATNTAEITGDVVIRRGPNVLEGAKATVDLNTNVSRMYGKPSGQERIRGIFYPGSQ